MNFTSLHSYTSLSLFSPDSAWICNNETGFGIDTDDLPSDWCKSILRASIKGDVKFAQPMSGEEMANYLSGIYADFSDAAHQAKSANSKPDTSRFFSQDETKEDF